MFNRYLEQKTITEEEMIFLLKQKNESAFSAFYDNYSAAIYGVILSIVITQDEAEDVLQEIFMKIWNNFSTYDSSKGRLFTWVITIARNLAVDRIRSQRYRNNQKDVDIEKHIKYIDIQKNISFVSDAIGIKEIVAKLKPNCFEVVDLIYFKGCTHTEAAEVLNLPLGTVKTRLRMAICSLKETML